MKTFSGPLENCKPDFILKENEHTRLEEFFLILGVIYNDLKGLIFFLSSLEGEYRQPKPDEISYHHGEFGGIRTQIDKLVCSTIHEFFNYLENYRDVIATPRFKLMIKRMGTEREKEWGILVNIAFDKKADKTKFAMALLKIRNNVGYHYNQSGKELSRAFIDNFYIREKDGSNDFAYFSLGGNMVKTRFFYADAAVSNYYREEMGTVSGYSLRNCVNDMNQVIYALMEAYLRRKYL